jgi:anti-sigma factor RsiW
MSNHLGEDKLFALVTGMAGELEAERMAPHLAECQDCQTKVADLEAEQQVLGQLLGASPGEPPRRLEKQIVRRIYHRPLRLRFPLKTLVAAAAGVGAVAAGLHLFPAKTPREQMIETVRFSEARALGLSIEGR